MNCQRANRTEQNRRILWLATLLISILVIYGYGLVTVAYHVFPYQQIISIKSCIANISDTTFDFSSQKTQPLNYEWIKVKKIYRANLS